MFKRILVPTDGSPLADSATEVGRKIAAGERARLILLWVEPERATTPLLIVPPAQYATAKAAEAVTETRLVRESISVGFTPMF